MSESRDLILQNFIDAHVQLVEPLLREAALAEWDLQTTSEMEAQERSAALNARIAKIYASETDFNFLLSVTPSDIEDPLLLRQHTLLLNAYRGSQMSDETIDAIVELETSISETFNSFRPQVNGVAVSDNAIDDVLFHNNDSKARKTFWLASKEVGAQVSERLLSLVRMRNTESRRLGFDNYYSMSLTLQEQDEDALFALLESLHQESSQIWSEYRTNLDHSLGGRYGVLTENLRPWHHANRFFQEPGPGAANLDRFFEGVNLEPITAQFFQNIGLPVDDLLEIADLYERPGKCQHAFCLDVDRKGDVRVLCNNRSDERWMSTTLHEFGHAIYDKYLDQDLPYLLREPAHILTTEAIALFMGRLTKDAHWLRIYAGVDPAEADRISAAARHEVQDYLLVFMRWCFVMCHFERALYRDPEQDLDGLWWSLVEKYQDINCPVEDRWPGMWAAKVHLATAPVYYHNYLLGEMTASQLLCYLQGVVLKESSDTGEALVTEPVVGAWLKEALFSPGSRYRWDTWLVRATGEPLNPEYYVRDLRR